MLMRSRCCNKKAYPLSFHVCNKVLAFCVVTLSFFGYKQKGIHLQSLPGSRVLYLLLSTHVVFFVSEVIGQGHNFSLS
jgi:hypothetical protein